MLTFFALAYGLSWASYYVFSGPVVFTLGPFLAAVIVASATNGRDGLRDLASRILRWRVRPISYAAALSVPVGIGVATAALTAMLATPTPSAGLGPWYRPFAVFATVLLTADTLCEETGWRAFAMPRFSADRSPFANTLILGVLLAGWHLPVALSEPSGAVAPYLVATIASAVITNWVYYSGRESALLAWLYHTAANTAGLYFVPLSSGANRVTYFWALAAVNLVVAAVIVLATGRALARPSDLDHGRPVE